MRNADSIKAKLKNIAVTQNKQFDYLLMLYFIERLLFRVSISKYRTAFVLKGGLLLYTILDEKARATKDVDFLAREMENTLEELESIFREICTINSDDAVLFDISTLKAERIKEDADYEGVRVKVVAHLDRSKKMLQFDIGFGDVIVPKALEMEYPSLLDLEKPKIMVYSKESVIAEKFEAMIYLAETNSRMKDFYDIYCLCTKFGFDGRILFEAISKTFERRGTPLSKVPTIFTDDFRKSVEKSIQWNAFSRRINSEISKDFLDLMDVITTFTRPIYECIISEVEFFGIWDNLNTRWEK